MRCPGCCVVLCIVASLTGGCAEEPGTRTFSEGFVEGCEGHRIAYQKWTDNDGAEGTLIFSNGRTEYTDKYHHLLPIIQRDLDVIFFDHFGQGRSDGIRAHVNSVDDEHACDLQQVVYEVSEPEIPRYLLSHSMGGLAAIRAIQRDPALVDASVFSAPMWGFSWPEGLSEESARAMAEVMVESGLAEEPMFEDSGDIAACEDARLTHDCDLYDQFKDDPLTHIGASTWGAGVAFFEGMDLMMAELDAVAIPVHVMTAGDEHYVDPDSHPVVCDGINSLSPGLCSQSFFGDDWHELLNEVDRAQYLEEALSFFDQHGQ